MSKKVNVETGNIFLQLLLLVFIYMKLAGIGVVATWSWWWVMAPFWIPLFIAIVIFAVVLFAQRISK